MVYNTRKRAKAANSANLHTDCTPTPAKRIKQSPKDPNAPARVRRKGALQSLPKMPLDIIDEVSYSFVSSKVSTPNTIVLYQVLTRLGMSELLALSRTTKAFRELVMNIQAERFWKAALENSKKEGVPACPEWLSLPAYANLLYSPHCHVRISV